MDVSAATHGRSENVFAPRHWLGVVDARPLSLFRILLGLVLLQDLAARSLEFRPFLTAEGLFPQGSRSAGVGFSVFHLVDTPLAVALVFAAGVLVTLAVTLGFATRIATPLAWVFFVSLHRRCLPIYSGGDALVDLVLFFACFVDWGARFSLDALRAGPRSEVRALVVRMLQYLPALMYLYTARQKLLEDGRGWLGGPILFQHLQLDGWVRPPGEWLGAHPTLCAFGAAATIAVEVLIPVLVVLPVWIAPARALAILCNLGLQLGILLTLKVGIFTFVMFSISVLWLLPEWFERLGGRFARVTSVRPVPPWDPARRLLAAAVTVVFVAVSLVPPVGSHLPMFVHRTLSWAGLTLTAGMFTRAAPSKRWLARGHLADGTNVDPLAVVAPNAFEGGFVNSQWMQLPYHLEEYEGIGGYVCRRYNARAKTAALRSWTLLEIVRPPHLPGEPRAREASRPLRTESCREDVADR